jgi:predicted RNA-binding Zn ribbon-like protein
LLAIVAEAQADGSWERMKACPWETCRWAFYDHSKNRSRTWCEWGCGNKVKTRNYRARQRRSTTSTGS